RLRFIATALFAALVVVRHDARHRGHEIAHVEIHELHALRVAAGHAHILHWGPNDLPAARDQHDLVLRQHLEQRHDIAGFLRAIDGLDALAAALLHAVFVDAGAF